MMKKAVESDLSKAEGALACLRATERSRRNIGLAGGVCMRSELRRVRRRRLP